MKNSRGDNGSLPYLIGLRAINQKAACSVGLGADMLAINGTGHKAVIALVSFCAGLFPTAFCRKHLNGAGVPEMAL